MTDIKCRHFISYNVSWHNPLIYSSMNVSLMESSKFISTKKIYFFLPSLVLKMESKKIERL